MANLKKPAAMTTSAVAALMRKYAETQVTAATQRNSAGQSVPTWSMVATPPAAEKTVDFDAVLRDNNVRYGMPYATFDDLISYFDISRLPDYIGMPIPLVGHIIFTRPSLNVNVGGSANFSAMLANPMSATFANDKYGKKLLNMLSEYSTNPYMPIFTTRATSYTVQDVSLKTVEKAQTYYGHVIKYGKHSEEHKIGGTITIDFRNDRYNSILKAVQLWAAYIWIVSKNDSIVPSDTSQKNAILDYCGSIYYFVTDLAMDRLYYWEKLTGVFPRVTPFSIFSYNDAPILEDKLSVEFDYGVKSDPNDPDVLFDINMLSAQSYGQAVSYFSNGVGGWKDMARPDSYEKPFGLGNAFALRPVIRARNQNGSISYHLQYTAAI